MESANFFQRMLDNSNKDTKCPVCVIKRIDSDTCKDLLAEIESKKPFLFPGTFKCRISCRKFNLYTLEYDRFNNWT